MKRAVAHAVFFLCCLSSSIGICSGAELNSFWQTVGQAKVSKNIKSAVPFQPSLTLEENNRKLKSHRSQSFVVSSTVPLKNLSQIQLVNRSARWQFDGQAYSGRVTAVMLSADRQSVTVFAEISNPPMSFSATSAGLLSVEG